MKHTKSGLALVCLMMGLAALPQFVPQTKAAEGSSGFTFKDTPGQYLDILMDGRLAGRYMYAYDKSNAKTLTETFKTYLHVYDNEGKTTLTKGSGGTFPHHRGIFIGWNKMGFNGKTYDRWHMKGGEIVHQKFTGQKAGQDEATFTSITHWNDDTGKPMIVEERTMTFRRAKAPARLMVDFVTTLNAPNGDVMLDGDPEHAGVQFRPANEVVAKETLYVFPKEKADAHKDKDYPWVGETFTLNGKRHSVVQMNHPQNPKDTLFSAYRDYGRFGAFFKAPIKSGQALKLNYRFLIADGEMPPVAFIQQQWDQFAGAPSPSPVPPISILPRPKAQ